MGINLDNLGKQCIGIKGRNIFENKQRRKKIMNTEYQEFPYAIDEQDERIRPGFGGFGVLDLASVASVVLDLASVASAVLDLASVASAVLDLASVASVVLDLASVALVVLDLASVASAVLDLDSEDHSASDLEDHFSVVLVLDCRF